MDYCVHVSHPRHINCMNYPGLIRMLNTQKLEKEKEARGTCDLWLPSCVCKAPTSHSLLSYSRFSRTICCGCSSGKGFSADRPCTKWVRTLGEQFHYYVCMSGVGGDKTYRIF